MPYYLLLSASFRIVPTSLSLLVSLPSLLRIVPAGKPYFFSKVPTVQSLRIFLAITFPPVLLVSCYVSCLCLHFSTVVKENKRLVERITRCYLHRVGEIVGPFLLTLCCSGVVANRINGYQLAAISGCQSPYCTQNLCARS